MESLQSNLFGKYAGYLTHVKGFKGEQVLPTSDEDALKMYEEHTGQRSILSKAFKQVHRIHSLLQSKRAQACESHLLKMDELQKLVDKLKEKHKEGRYFYL